MSKWLAPLCCFFTLTAWCGGDEDVYAVTQIPSALLKNANVVKRMESIRFEIKDNNKARLFQKVAYTILNAGGDNWAYFSKGYDKLRGVESFEGTLFDKTGKRIKRLKKSDIMDASAAGDESFADDSRMKWHSFYYKSYPYTIEYEVEMKFKGTMFIPYWIPQERPVMSVQQALITVEVPASNPLRFKMFNYPGEPTVVNEKLNKVYSWSVDNIPAIEPEYASPSWHEITTSVFLASEHFTIEDYKGNNISWKDFGRFQYELKKDRDVLPNELKQKVREITNSLPNDKAKIAALYQYMQENTRYISIQLGIGGWQPFDAKYVATRKYGDCKALSNFMYSLLKEAGIRSVYTLINAGENDDYLLSDLPSSQFNHVILFVPGNNHDTTWLECTSQTGAAGYLGSSTGNRFALAVDEQGGTLVRTPNYGVNENLQIRTITASINETGNLSAIVTTNYRAMQQDRLHAMTNGLSKDKLMEFLKEDIELPTYDIRSFAYKEKKDALPVIAETLDLVSENYANVSGKRLFILPNIMSREHQLLSMQGKRKFDIVTKYEFRDIDSTTITIPPGYKVESMPAPLSINNKFGKYSASSRLEGNNIIYYRSYEHFSGRFPASDYSEMVNFYTAVYTADRSKIVLVKE